MSFLLVGIAAGVVGGLFGVGGGAILVPILIYLFGFSQYRAQGTSLLVLLLPAGLLAVLHYYKAGYVDVKAAALLALGFFGGGYFGSVAATGIQSVLLQRLFGGFLLMIALQMIFGSIRQP